MRICPLIQPVEQARRVEILVSVGRSIAQALRKQDQAGCRRSFLSLVQFFVLRVVMIMCDLLSCVCGLHHEHALKG